MTKRVGKPADHDVWAAYQPRERAPRDYETQASILDVYPPSQSEMQLARVTASHYANDAEELKQFLLMLGIYPVRQRVVTQK